MATTEVQLITTISLECLFLELFEVDKLCLVDDKTVERHRVRCTCNILRYKSYIRTVIETDYVIV